MKKEMKKKIIILISLSLISIALLINIGIVISDKHNQHNEDNKKEELKDNEPTKQNVINLNEYKDNVTINNDGEYTLTGTFNNTVLVNSKENVIINLDNVNIDSQSASAIANKGFGEMIINIKEGTTNILKDKGYSEFDGCIYSRGKLTITGKGDLKVYGNQEDGEGIATTDNDIAINGGNIYIESNDDGINIGGRNGGVITINDGQIIVKANGDGIDSNGSLIINGGNMYIVGSTKEGDSGIDVDKTFEINGGELIVLGSTMQKKPNKTSKQKYITFSFKEPYLSGTKVTIKKENKNIIELDEAETFRIFVLSNDKIDTGIYQLYINDQKTNYTYDIK